MKCISSFDEKVSGFVQKSPLLLYIYS